MSIIRRRRPAAADGDSTGSAGAARARTGRRAGRAALVVAGGAAVLALAGPLALGPSTGADRAAGPAVVLTSVTHANDTLSGQQDPVRTTDPGGRRVRHPVVTNPVVPTTRPPRPVRVRHVRTRKTAVTTTTNGLLAGKGAPHSTSSTTTTSTYPDAASTTLPPISIPADPEVGLASRSATAAHTSPGPDPLFLGGLVVVALAIGAFTWWRRRTRTP